MSVLETIDITLRDIGNSNNAMGGITLIFSGDFRQILPVIVRETRADIIKSCSKPSSLWKSV